MDNVNDMSSLGVLGKERLEPMNATPYHAAEVLAETAENALNHGRYALDIIACSSF